jgi:hypothetical protein
VLADLSQDFIEQIQGSQKIFLLRPEPYPQVMIDHETVSGSDEDAESIKSSRVNGIKS